MIFSDKVNRQTIKDQVADKLAFMIQTGLLQAGDDLPSERELARTLDVSRESVRGAITLLRAHNMVKVTQGNRTRVIGASEVPFHHLIGILSGLEDHDIAQVAEARSHFEVDVVRLAAIRISNRDLNRLDALLTEQRNMLDDPVRFQISDREFHMALYEACGNTLMASVASDLYYFALDMRRRALLRPGTISESVLDHERIVDALKNHDPDRAAERMLRHKERISLTTREELES